MKKTLLIIALFVLASSVAISCKKKIDNCSDLISKVNATGTTYGLNPTTANCQAYKTALNNFLGCPVITAQERAAYQQLFNQLTC
jgi:uncharacterized protein YaaR (DUF327 family)